MNKDNQKDTSEKRIQLIDFGSEEPPLILPETNGKKDRFDKSRVRSRNLKARNDQLEGELKGIRDSHGLEIEKITAELEAKHSRVVAMLKATLDAIRTENVKGWNLLHVEERKSAALQDKILTCVHIVNSKSKIDRLAEILGIKS